MRIAILLILILGPMFSYAQRNGGDVGNGGDVIRCHPSRHNFLNGLYSLDYVLTLPNAQSDSGLREIVDWNQSVTQMHQLFLDKVPEFAAGFLEFAGAVFSQPDYSKAHVFEAAPFGLLPLDDEKIVTQLPENCHAEGEPKPLQAIIRHHSHYSGSKSIVYRYSKSLLEELRQSSPLQLSFLLIHEWLWSQSSNVDRNRRLNRFLHSELFANMTREQVRLHLEGMGLSTGEIGGAEKLKPQCRGAALTPTEVRNIISTGISAISLGQIQVLSRSRENKESPWTDWQSVNARPNRLAILARGPQNFRQLVHVLDPGSEIETAFLSCQFIKLSELKQLGPVRTEFNLQCSFKDGRKALGLLTDQCFQVNASPSLGSTKRDFEELILVNF